MFKLQLRSIRVMRRNFQTSRKSSRNQIEICINRRWLTQRNRSTLLTHVNYLLSYDGVSILHIQRKYKCRRFCGIYYYVFQRYLYKFTV